MDFKDRDLNITISAGTIVKAIFIVLLFFFLFSIKDLVLVVLMAIVIASSMEPLIVWLGRFKIKRLPAVIATYLAVALVFSGLFYFFVPLVVKDTAGFLGAVPRYIDSVTLWNPLQEKVEAPKAAARSISQGFAEGTAAVQNLSDSFSVNNFFNDLGRTLSNVSEAALRAISAVFGGVLSFILIIVLSFYLAVQENGIANFLRIVTPVRHEGYVINLWKRAEQKIGYWMQGQLFLGFLVGVIVYPALAIIGVKNALFLALLAAVFEIIPLFGPILSAIPAIIISYADGGLGKALFVAGAYTVIQQFENHLVYPAVVKKIIGVPPIIVILSLIIGGKLAGFLGVILAVPVATILMEYLNDLQSSKLARQGK